MKVVPRTGRYCRLEKAVCSLLIEDEDETTKVGIWTTTLHKLGDGEELRRRMMCIHRIWQHATDHPIKARIWIRPGYSRPISILATISD